MVDIGDYNIGTTVTGNGELHLGFGGFDDVPNHSSGDPQGYLMFNLPGNNRKTITITRANSATRRGFHRGGVRVGFRLQDITAGPISLFNTDETIKVRLFCWGQEINDDTFNFDWASVPDPSAGKGDKVEGKFYWDLEFGLTAVEPDVSMTMGCEGRVPSIGGRALSNTETFTHGRTFGDFLGFELQWWASDDPLTENRPIVYLRGYSFYQSDFSDAKLRQIVGWDYRVRTSEERTQAFERNAFNWNVSGVFGLNNPDIKPPLLEGAEITSTGTTDGSFPLVHFEIMDGL